MSQPRLMAAQVATTFTKAIVMIPIITWPATRLAKIRIPIDKGRMKRLNNSTGQIRIASHKGVPIGKNLAATRLLASMRFCTKGFISVCLLCASMLKLM